MKTFFIAFLSFVMVTFVSSASSGESLTAPKLTNNPSLDVIATNKRPLLSIFNASGGTGKRTYIFQIDTVPDFDSESFIEYKDIPETNEYITEKQIEKKDALSPSGKTRYYWRARAVDEVGNKGPWGQTRFFLDTASDDALMNLLRIPVKEVTVSSGQNPKNIMDLDDPGQSTFWLSSPPGDPVQWIVFDFGTTQKVSSIWMLSASSASRSYLQEQKAS